MSAVEAEVVSALGATAFYPHAPTRVEHVQTHISHVFLAGPYVYKLKKAVRFSFLDFSTPERRRHFCEEEVRLNARLCPGVYLGVLPITREAGGMLALDGAGPAVAHVVWMRRLPAERMLVHLLERGAVPAAVLERLAVRLVDFHAGVPNGPEVARHADPEALCARCIENSDTEAPFVGSVLPAEDHEILADFGPSFIRRHETLLRARQEGGHIRDGHGDLHAEHVCWLDAPAGGTDALPPLPPGLYVFDGIEFSPALRANDVASEIAFLAMDLEHRGHPDLAARFVAAYVRAAGDPTIELLVPFYACYRACVRGKVASLTSAEAEVGAAERAAALARAHAYFALALRYAWRAGEPVVIACCGLSGAGKSALAGALGEATGFPVLSSDVIRKRGADVHHDADGTGAAGGGTVDDAAGRGIDAYGEGRYTPAARDAVYETLAAEVGAALAAGRSVIADATFLARRHRDRLATIARQQRRHHVFVECRADEAAVRVRLGARTAAAVSDARWATYVAQRGARDAFGADEPVVVVDTGGALAAARAAALRRLWPWRQGRPAPRA